MYFTDYQRVTLKRWPVCKNAHWLIYSELQPSVLPPRLGCGQPLELAQVLIGALVEGGERPAYGLHLVDADLVLVAVALPCAPSVVLLGVEEDADVYLAKVVEDGEPLLLDVRLHSPQGY